MKNRKLTLSSKLYASEIIAFILIIIGALFLGVLLNSQVLAIADVRSVSMQDTLAEGEKLFVNKLAYRNSDPKRGDIVIFLKGEEVDGFSERFIVSFQDITSQFKSEQRENRLIKRVIGLPGEKLEIKDGKVYINDEAIEEEYVRGITFPDMMNESVIIPPDMFFVMGDNRLWSSDSRRFGMVEKNSIEGKAVFRFWPFDKITTLKYTYTE